MSKKLLHKTQRVYLLFSIGLFVVVAPLFYVILKKLYVKDVDESLQTYKTAFLKNTLPNLKEKDIVNWNLLNVDSKIRSVKKAQKDSLYYTNYYNAEEQENELYRELISPIKIAGKPYVFSARVNLIESEDLITNIALLFLSIIILMLLGLYSINKKLSLNLWKPFYKTLQQIENFELDKNNKPVFKTTNTEEFNRLNASIKKLIEKNQMSYENQREFIENAAHELQTPVAVFKAKIDTLIQRSDITQGQSEILSSLNNTISRLNRLNKNLLLLSKIDKNQFKEIETFSIQKILKKQLIFFKEQANSKNITVTTHFKKEIIIDVNYGLSEILLSNLLLNAIKHNTQDGKITINLSNKKLEIFNTGNNNPLDAEKLFSRFSKLNADSQGNGLGLAIVKKIADLNNWTIAYSFLENKHCFTVIF